MYVPTTEESLEAWQLALTSYELIMLWELSIARYAHSLRWREAIAISFVHQEVVGGEEGGSNQYNTRTLKRSIFSKRQMVQILKIPQKKPMSPCFQHINEMCSS